jgi:hypothetical protein
VDKPQDDEFDLERKRGLRPPKELPPESEVAEATSFVREVF